MARLDLRTTPPLLLAALVGSAIGCAGSQTTPDETPTPSVRPTAQVVSASEVTWEQLNPARGDKSPQAATLWGDRKGPVPTGFLAKFVDGFSSPPHLHNATYRAVVISGLLHNDDPDAAPMWMPPGSFWTQPKGEVHITSAKGASTVALVEIDRGPYLVLPPEEAFDSGERPINAAAANIVWVDPPGTEPSADGPQLAYLWGSLARGQTNGTFVRLPAGCTATIHSHSLTFRAVVITGQPRYGGAEAKALPPGSYFSSEGEWVHELSSPDEGASVIYIRSEGTYEVAGRG